MASLAHDPFGVKKAMKFDDLFTAGARWRHRGTRLEVKIRHVLEPGKFTLALQVPLDQRGLDPLPHAVTTAELIRDYDPIYEVPNVYDFILENSQDPS